MSLRATVILAGGRGERLGGVDKARLKVGGRTLLDRVRAALAPASGPVLVALPWGGPEPAPADGLVYVRDPVADPGPLGGLAAAMAWCLDREPRPDTLLSVAVDTPALPPDFAARLESRLAPGVAAVAASCGGQIHPTNALWRVEAFADLSARLAAGSAPAGPKALLSERDCRTCDWDPVAGIDPFSSINTLQDLMKFQRLLGFRRA